jgi:hypothetical protein
MTCAMLIKDTVDYRFSPFFLVQSFLPLTKRLRSEAKVDLSLGRQEKKPE